MKKLVVVMLALMALALALVACGGSDAADHLGAIKDAGVIKVSTDPNYEPQSFLDENGDFTGFDVDVAREIGKRLGVEVEFVTPDWDVITAGNWAGQWDMSVGSMTITTARQEVLDFADPAYYFTPAQFAAAIGSGIDSLDDLAGQPVCVGVSTTYETWLDGRKAELGLPESSFYSEVPSGVTIVPLATDAECPQSIQAGREEFKAFLTSNTVVQAAIAGGLPVEPIGSPVFSEDLGVAFDKNSELNNDTLVAEVGKIISDMRADGTLKELSMKWFGEDLTADPSQ